MKKIALAALLLLAPISGANSQTLVGNFDDIQFWTGSGTNRSALVLQWNDGNTPTSMTWGYRWGGNATGIDMLKAIAGTTNITPPGAPEAILETWGGADSRLTLSMKRFDFGDSLFSVAFNDGVQNRNQAAWTNEYWNYSLFGGQFAYDSYDADWNYLGSADYSQSGNINYSSVIWFTSPIGASDRELVDGSWDAWNFFATDSEPESVQQPFAAAVPEPSVTILLGAAFSCLMLMRRRSAGK
jgi:hypothetical protein